MKNKMLFVVSLCAATLMNASWQNDNNNPNTPNQSHKRCKDQSSDDRSKKLQRQKTPEFSPASASVSSSSSSEASPAIHNVQHDLNGFITQPTSPLLEQPQLVLLAIHGQLSDYEDEDESDNEAIFNFMPHSPNPSDLDTNEDSDMEEDFATPLHGGVLNMPHAPAGQNVFHNLNEFITPLHMHTHVQHAMAHNQIALEGDLLHANDNGIPEENQAMNIVSPLMNIITP